MWIPKWQRDRIKGVDSPMPTQVVSNEEFIPRPQNEPVILKRTRPGFGFWLL